MIDSVVKNMYIFILLMKSCSSIFALLSVPASIVEALCLEFRDYSSTNIPNCIEGLLKVNYLLLITSQSAGYEFFKLKQRIKLCAFKFETVLEFAFGFLFLDLYICSIALLCIVKLAVAAALRLLICFVATTFVV